MVCGSVYVQRFGWLGHERGRLGFRTWNEKAKKEWIQGRKNHGRASQKESICETNAKPDWTARTGTVSVSVPITPVRRCQEQLLKGNADMSKKNRGVIPQFFLVLSVQPELFNQQMPSAVFVG